LLASQFQWIQQREEHWVIADLVGKGGHVPTVPMWPEKTRSQTRPPGQPQLATESFSSEP
jgi:hypothetical protein